MERQMTTYTMTQALKVAQADSRGGDIRAAIEQAIIQKSREYGAVYYKDVGPTGDWTVYGDCYDWAEANPTVTIEV
jgi:hypothetical protein